MNEDPTPAPSERKTVSPPPPPPVPVQIDVEKIIGRMVLEMEMLRANALADRRNLLAEIENLKAR